MIINKYILNQQQKDTTDSNFNQANYLVRPLQWTREKPYISLFHELSN